MKLHLKNIIYFLLRLLPTQGVVVLTYHSIDDNHESFTVSKENFEKQMGYLRTENFNVISLGSLIDILKDKKAIPPNAVIVTFDDGYEDNLLNAFPILKEYNIPAIIFVNTAQVGRDVVARKGTELRILSVDQIKELASSSLIEVGSHSHNHKKFTHLSEGEMIEELATSKKILEGIVSKKISCFAYPSGRVSELAQSVVSQYYMLAFGVRPGRVIHEANMLDLKRNSIDSDVTFAQFKGIVRFGRI